MLEPKRRSLAKEFADEVVPTWGALGLGAVMSVPLHEYGHQFVAVLLGFHSHSSGNLTFTDPAATGLAWLAIRLAGGLGSGALFLALAVLARGPAKYGWATWAAIEFASGLLEGFYPGYMTDSGTVAIMTTIAGLVVLVILLARHMNATSRVEAVHA